MPSAERQITRRGRLAHRLLLERDVDESRLSSEQLAVRERMFLARNFAYAWLCGGLLQLGMLAVPTDGRRDGFVVIAAVVGLLASAAHFLLYERIPPEAYFASTALGWVAAGLDLWAAGEQGIVSVLFFSWIAVYASGVFRLRFLLGQVPIAGVCLTIAISARDDGVSSWYGPFAMATIVTMCVLVYAGRRRTLRLFAAVQRDRVEREQVVANRQAVAEIGTGALAAVTLDETRRLVTSRIDDHLGGVESVIRPKAAEATEGTNVIAIPGSTHELAVSGRPLAGDELVFLASTGRILGLSEQRFAAEQGRVRLEAELHDARRLEAIGRLAGGVAHDFNNVLTVIIGNTELAVDDLVPGSPAERRLGEVLTASRRAAALVAQLLALGSRQALHPGPLDLGAVVEGLAGILQRLLGEGCTLVLDLAEDIPPCHADPTQMEQVILNLVANARDAMRSGGQVTISTTLVDDPADAPSLSGSFVALCVEDTGVGMDEETRRRVFEPFFSSKPFGEGTGLDLATVHGIVTQTGGAIAIESAPGEGTTFRVYLPVHAPETPSSLLTTVRPSDAPASLA